MGTLNLTTGVVAQSAAIERGSDGLDAFAMRVSNIPPNNLKRRRILAYCPQRIGAWNNEWNNSCPFLHNLLGFRSMTTIVPRSENARPPKHLLTLKEGEEKLQPYKNLLEECIQHGWDSWEQDYKHKHHLLSTRARAAIVFDEIIFHAESRFSGLPGVTFQRRHNTFLLHIGDDVVVRFKKIGRNGKCSSIDTRQQVLFSLQMQLPGMEKGTMLHAGYTLDDLQQQVVRKLIVCQFSNRVLWTINLAAEMGSVVENMPIASPPAPQQPKQPRFAAKSEGEKQKSKKQAAGKE
jgi:hypothetical protein